MSTSWSAVTELTTPDGQMTWRNDSGYITAARVQDIPEAADR